MAASDTKVTTRSFMNAARWSALIALILLILIGAVALELNSEDPAFRLSWMAWTKPTAIFFITIAGLLIAMMIWEAIVPGGGPRVGILRFETTRGDRLFLTLLGSAFIHLAWLFFVGPELWKALGLSVVYALLVFMLV